MSDKQSRAETIVASIMELDAKYGGPLPLGKAVGRIIRRENWEVRICPDRRWSVARGYRDKACRRVIPAPNWHTVELRLMGREMFFVSIRDERVDIHHFQPGAWEERFGSHPGDDSVLQTAFDVPIGPNAAAQIEQRNQDAQLPPERTGPATGDELRNATMRQTPRSRAPGGSSAAYTVALSGRRIPGI